MLLGQSDNHNLKYMGIDALGRLIKLSPNVAEQHQLAVIDCLEVRTYPIDANGFLLEFFWMIFFSKLSTHKIYLLVIHATY